MNDTHSLSHTKRHCKYHIVSAPKYRRQVIKKGNRKDIKITMRMETNRDNRGGDLQKSYTHVSRKVYQA